ncbi:MAG: hypothetical protein EBR81_00110 [Proteobacteria bacterium]|nr:hypothetical protein [Pseudomonadota bacterium]
MYLQRNTCVSVGGGGVIFPDDFTFWAQLADFGPAGLKQEVPVGEQRGVMEPRTFHIALQSAVRRDHSDPACVGHEQSVGSAGLPSNCRKSTEKSERSGKTQDET